MGTTNERVFFCPNLKSLMVNLIIHNDNGTNFIYLNFKYSLEIRMRGNFFWGLFVLNIA